MDYGSSIVDCATILPIEALHFNPHDKRVMSPMSALGKNVLHKIPRPPVYLAYIIINVKLMYYY